MPRVLFDFEFDGAAFQGTQSQAKGERTLASVVTPALLRFSDAPVVRFASRLDGGVGAVSLPADVWIDRVPKIGLGALARAVTSRLPPDAAVTSIAPVADDFDAIRKAVAKTYTYRLLLRGTAPARDRRCWWIEELDHPEILDQLAARITGRHDLRGFACLRHDDTDQNDGTRTIYSASWTWTDAHPGRLATLRIRGAGFLYKQIRGFVGAMVSAAQGRRPVADFLAIADGQGDITRLGNLAPPDGLCLESVEYDPPIAWLDVTREPRPTTGPKPSPVPMPANRDSAP